MTKKMDFILGILLGLFIAFLGSFLFVKLFTPYTFEEGFLHLKSQGNLGKLITLGALSNIAIVFLLFKKNKDLIAKGVILSLFILTLYTVFL